MSKQQVVFLILFASTTLAVTALAIVKLQAPVQISVLPLLAFSLVAGLIV